MINYHNISESLEPIGKDDLPGEHRPDLSSQGSFNFNPVLPLVPEEANDIPLDRRDQPASGNGWLRFFSSRLCPFPFQLVDKGLKLPGPVFQFTDQFPIDFLPGLNRFQKTMLGDLGLPNLLPFFLRFREGPFPLGLVLHQGLPVSLFQAHLGPIRIDQTGIRIDHDPKILVHLPLIGIGMRRERNRLYSTHLVKAYEPGAKLFPLLLQSSAEIMELIPCLPEMVFGLD